VDITRSGQEETFDGVRIVFQMTPNTEAPAEMNFHFPDRRALCMAENAVHNLHNILTLRGAVVRDARMWSRYLAEAIELFVEDSDVAFASHHWPTWGRDRIVTFLAQQRDLYAYLHDQTLRLMNQGYVGGEIAEMLEVPPGLDAAWHTHGYYGSFSHNVKATFQRYLGWYDGNPAHLWQHPPEATAARYVEAIGGVDATVSKATAFAAKGDLRFAVELASHAVFADPTHAEAKELLAASLERLGFGAENATWRNCFLMGARELRDGVFPTPLSATGESIGMAMSITQLFDAVAIRIDGPRASSERLSVNWHMTDVDERYRMELSNGALIHFPTTKTVHADLTVSLSRPQLLRLLSTGSLDGVAVDGDPGILKTLLSLTDQPDPSFNVVTP
jgi:alkyl sulfatase BDS1-like metallo-beta-lactamase superfamily hydrolase